MREVEFSAGQLIALLLKGDAFPGAAILDSCGVGHVGSHLLIAGREPSEGLEIKDKDVAETLATLDHIMSQDRAAIFTISYDFGARMLGIEPDGESSEPDVYIATFDSLLIHDYDTGRTSQIGATRELPAPMSEGGVALPQGRSSLSSNFSKTDYVAAIKEIQELIRDGFTYQTNLTHQLTAALPESLTPEAIFHTLRQAHPTPFAAFIRRLGSTVVSASPERFFRIHGDAISTSPIKGTRRRGETRAGDLALRQELLASEKDRAENTMIVDLLRNDLGRVCEYGSVTVEKLCDLEEHPTLFHLVSTVNGKLRADARFSDILWALFPCGSI
ncbi:MAG: chorismate-binding protein, partial [Blastocatellia bacterium]|nr:chorismate-binding protein [Blastocatellia bacterium]